VFNLNHFYMISLDQKKYPIGRFEAGKTYSAKDLKNLIEDIEKFPKQLKKTLGKLSGEEMDTAYRPGGWTARQVVHHIADSHMNAYIRFKLAATENTPSAKTYEEGLWAELFDGKNAPVKASLKIISALHKRWVIFLKNLTSAQLKKGYFSPGAGRVVSISEGIALYSWHGKHHIGHIKLLTGWEPAFVDSQAEIAAEPKKRSSASSAKKVAQTKVVDAPKQKTVKEKAAPIAKVVKEKAAPIAKVVKEKAAPIAKAVKEKAAPIAKVVKEKAAPKVKAVSDKPKRVRRTPEQMAADKITAAAEKAAKPPVDRSANLAKARAKAAENRVAAGYVPKVVVEKTRKNRTKEQIAADKITAAAEKAAKPPVDRAANLVKARATAAANRAASGKVPKVKPETTRKYRTSEEVAAAKIAAAAEKASKPPVDRSANLAKARAAAAANRAALGHVPKVKTEPIRIRRTPEQIAADTAAAAKAKAARPPIDRAAQMAKARAVALANRLAAGYVPKEKVVNDGPKLTRTEALAKARATAAANRAAAGYVPKEKVVNDGPKLSRTEALAKARATAAANRAAAGYVPKEKIVNDGPKLTRTEALAKARATAAANRAAAGYVPKEKIVRNGPKLTREEALAKARTAAAANRAAKK
jgi:DinB superfamily